MSAMRSVSACSWRPMTPTGVSTAIDHAAAPRTRSGTIIATVSPRPGRMRLASPAERLTRRSSPRIIDATSAASAGDGDSSAVRSAGVVAGSGRP